MKEEVKNSILEIHKNAIHVQTRVRPNGRSQLLWITKIDGRREITARSEDALLEKLLDFYSGNLENKRKKSYKLRFLFIPFLKWKSEEDITARTLKEYVRIWKKYYAECSLANRDIVYITGKEWMAMFREMCIKYKLTRKAFSHARIVIFGIIEYCIDEGILDYNPVRDLNYNRLPFVKEAPYNTIKAIPFTDSQSQEIINWAVLQINRGTPVPLYYFAIIFNILMGLRYGELAGLRWEDIDLQKEFLTVSGQMVLTFNYDKETGFTSLGWQRINHVKAYEDPRHLPLPETVIWVLEEIKKLKLSDEYGFPKKNFRYHTYNGKIKDGAEAIGLNPKDFRTHSLRTTAATNVYYHSYDIKQVQMLLGHTTPEMSAKYVRDQRGIDVLRATMEKVLLIYPGPQPL